VMCCDDIGQYALAHRGTTYRTGPNLPKRSKSSSGVTLKLGRFSA
jgi:hypothetical protein